MPWRRLVLTHYQGNTHAHTQPYYTKNSPSSPLHHSLYFLFPSCFCYARSKSGEIVLSGPLTVFSWGAESKQLRPQGGPLFAGHLFEVGPDPEEKRALAWLRQRFHRTLSTSSPTILRTSLPGATCRKTALPLEETRVPENPRTEASRASGYRSDTRPARSRWKSSKRYKIVLRCDLNILLFQQTANVLLFIHLHNWLGDNLAALHKTKFQTC